MSEKNPTETTTTPAPRLPYEKPQVVSEQVFETLAMSCARANPFVCPGGNPNRS